MSKKKRIPTNGTPGFGHNPFGGLSSEGLPAGADATLPQAPESQEDVGIVLKNRGRVDVQRQTAGRGGKTVTVVSGFTGIGLPEKETLARQMQKVCGCGGTVKEGRIEIQGDKRTEIVAILIRAGFRPVLTGG